MVSVGRVSRIAACTTQIYAGGRSGKCVNSLGYNLLKSGIGALKGKGELPDIR